MNSVFEQCSEFKVLVSGTFIYCQGTSKCGSLPLLSRHFYKWNIWMTVRVTLRNAQCTMHNAQPEKWPIYFAISIWERQSLVFPTSQEANISHSKARFSKERPLFGTECVCAAVYQMQPPRSFASRFLDFCACKFIHRTLEIRRLTKRCRIYECDCRIYNGTYRLINFWQL